MKTKKILTVYLAGAVAAAIGLAVWRTVLLYRYFDPYTGEFSSASFSSMKTLGYTVFALLLLAFTSLIFFRKHDFEALGTSGSQLSVFASSFLGCLCFASFLLALGYHRERIFADTQTLRGKLLPIALFLLIPCALHFIADASARFERMQSRKLLGIFPTLFSLFYLFSVFTDTKLHQGHSNNRLQCVALAVLAIFFIQEMRAVFYGKTDLMRFPAALAAIITLGVYELPNLIVTAFWDTDITHMTVLEFTLAGALILAVANARLVIRAVKKKEEPPKA